MFVLDDLGEGIMRWLPVIAFTIAALTLWLPGQAAEPAGGPHPAAAAGSTGAGPANITFADSRAWRLRWNERRRSRLTDALAVPDLPAERKAHLVEVKAYYDWLAGLADDERDRRFRERFERIDSDHDGSIDRAERAAWRSKRRAVFGHAKAARHAPPASGG
jgi:hypothetical protein